MNFIGTNGMIVTIDAEAILNAESLCFRQESLRTTGHDTNYLVSRSFPKFSQQCHYVHFQRFNHEL